MEDRRKKGSKKGGVDNAAFLEDAQTMQTQLNQQQMHQRRSESIHREQNMAATSAYSTSATEKGYTATQDLITPVILERATAHMPNVGQGVNNIHLPMMKTRSHQF